MAVNITFTDRGVGEYSSREGRKMGCATRGEKAAIIKELVDKKYNLKYLLKAVGMARSTYYYELNKVDVIAIRNKPILKEIKTIFC
ncbi:MAG: hypothetical protein V8S36_03590 [Lachnospiraceae bacterium]